MSRDGAVTTTGARSGSRGIVIAGDRTAARSAARRHSSIVKALKIALPTGGIAVAGLYGLSIATTIGLAEHIPALNVPKILPEHLAMQNPHYEGYSKDGGKYWVKADQAQQDLKNLNLIKLTAITGEITDGNKQKTTLKAARGTFDNSANVLELFEAIDVSGDGGLKAQLTRATIKTKDNIITSEEPVVVTMQAGQITASRMTARQKVKEYTFVDDVRTHLNGRAPDGKGAPPDDKSGAQLIGSSDAPVEILSSRLDINDETKIALFSGAVTAEQEGATLATPELEVHYEGGVTENAKGKGKDKGKSKDESEKRDGAVKRMIAKNPVIIKQANGDTVMSRNADFDPVAKRALLEGDVVMEQGPGKRATADAATIDQAANTVMLTGEVVVEQNGNVLKGRQLVYNQLTKKMQLTAPGPTAAGGRISAHFQQTRGSNAQAPQDTATPRAGIAFGATFKTDPNAPFDIDAARLDVDDDAKRAVFRGDVRAVQGDFVLKAAELTATYAGSAAFGGNDAEAAKQPAAQLRHIRARRKVEVTSMDGQKATGDWADFDPRANTASLGGNVVLVQGDNVVRGTSLVIDMNTGESVIKTDASAQNARPSVSADGTATAESAPAKRPSAVFYPGQIKNNGDNKKKSQAVDGWRARAQP